MLESIGISLLAYIEQEIIKHEPEIQQMVIDQLTKFASMIYEYTQQKTEAIAPTLLDKE